MLNYIPLHLEQLFKTFCSDEKTIQIQVKVEIPMPKTVLDCNLTASQVSLF